VYVHKYKIFYYFLFVIFQILLKGFLCSSSKLEDTDMVITRWERQRLREGCQQGQQGWENRKRGKEIRWDDHLPSKKIVREG
jgi:hypothetical protein